MVSQDAADAVPLPPPAEETPPVEETPPAAEETPPTRPLSRRQLLLALGAGGVALLGTNTGTAAASYRIGSSAARRSAQVEINGLASEVSLLQRQLALYDDMERIGLDHLIRAALETYDRLWPPVRSAINTLRGAVKLLEGGLDRFEPKLPTLQGAARLLGNLLTGIEAQMVGTQQAINELLARTGPVGEAVSGFLSWILDKIPFGVGDRVRDVADHLSALVSNIPPLIADVRHRLLEPIEGEWVGGEEGEDGLQAGLFDPLRDKLLTPLGSHLDSVEEMANGWDEDAKALREALDKRDAIRGEIARLRRGSGAA